MEKYSGIHDDHRYENKLTRVWTFCIIAHCNWSLFWTIFSFFLLKYLNIRTKIFKYLNGSRFKYSDNSIFWYCTLTKFMLFPNWTNLLHNLILTMHCWAKKNINDFGQSFFNWLMIYIWHFLWMYADCWRLMFVLYY